MDGALRFLWVTVACGLATACGSATSDALFSGTGSPSGSGGIIAGNGGHPAASGGASTASGGRNVSAGGFTASGGAALESGGASSGGVTSAGGAEAAGGSVELGGETGSGGVSGSGGAGTGGTGTGGTGTGGVTGNGGATGAGGAPLPTCSDRIKNQDETDIDCGGSVCPPCVPGQLCTLARDCSSGVCAGGLLGFGLCRIASCGDRIQNGLETDVDCGGLTCAGCATGKKCNVKSDCAYGTCAGGFCACTPQTCDQIAGACGPNIPDGCGNLLTCDSCALLCNDMKKDGNETAVDCGGPDCAKCTNGSACTTARDCQSGVCKATSVGAQATCRAPTCTDAVKNGAETDVDCGGAMCPKCANGRLCAADTDCTSSLCTNGICNCKPLTCADYPTQCGALSNGCGATMQCSCKPLCSDMMRDGHETDVDCGGADCNKCTSGQSCKVAADCDSGTCASDGGSALVCQ